jgi:16S rRNA (adenine1518-N6/adenine1519-N6)-dimethyltransferase
LDASEVRAQLRGLGLKAEKSLGQHFLLNRAIAERSVAYAGIVRDDTVLEIGPGLGMLTRILAARAKAVVAIEKDRRLLDVVDLPNIRYVHGDAVKVDIPPFDKVVSNLPYAISSPITFRLLERGRDFKVAVLMFQREFAERLASGPGSKDYSRLSVNAYVRARVELLDKVPRTAFYPRPKVDSSIVRMVPREPPFDVVDWDIFHKVVNAAFGQRRKKIRNSLAHAIKRGTIPTAQAVDLEKVPYGDERPERLSPEQFGEIADFLS